jgi:hypothetical protein
MSTRYQVRDEQRQVVSTHKSKTAAVKEAKTLNGSRVFMIERSGTYESITCVWPELGPTYTS